MEIYKQLDGLSKGFEELIAVIRSIGQKRAEILSLETKVDQVEARTGSQSMERIQEDLRQIREANAELMAKIEEATK